MTIGPCVPGRHAASGAIDVADDGSSDGHELSRLLEEAQGGDGNARDRLVAIIYEDLHKLARGLKRGRRVGRSLSTGDLVHEALARLFSGKVLERAANRRYLFGAAARAMRQVLCDHQRERQALKRGGGWGRTPLGSAIAAIEAQGHDFLALHEALDRLEALSPRQYLVVTYRFLLGMETAEAAEALGIAVSTAEKDWAAARAWLRGALGGDRS